MMVNHGMQIITRVYQSGHYFWVYTENSDKSSYMKTTVKVSFQFHHTQMDGAHAATFLGLIQQGINNL